MWLSKRVKPEDLLIAVQSDANAIIGVLMIIGLIFAVVLLLPLISVIGALLRHYGYRLTVDGETYRKNSRLLSRHDESMKRHKIQAVVWKQNFVARWFRRINIHLRVASAGSGIESGKLPGVSKATFLIPALHPSEAINLTAEFLPDCQPDQVAFSSVDRRRFTVKSLGIGWLPPIVGISVIPIFLVSWKFALAIPVAMGFAWLIVHQVWKKTGLRHSGRIRFYTKRIRGHTDYRVPTLQSATDRHSPIAVSKKRRSREFDHPPGLTLRYGALPPHGRRREIPQPGALLCRVHRPSLVLNRSLPRFSRYTHAITWTSPFNGLASPYGSVTIHRLSICRSLLVPAEGKQ